MNGTDYLAAARQGAKFQVSAHVLSTLEDRVLRMAKISQGVKGFAYLKPMSDK